MSFRTIEMVIPGILTSDGAGVNLRRIIGSPQLNMLDPFLLLDEFGSNNPEDYIAGFPPHPHRGFETITYMLNGKFHHQDSTGNEGHLTDGSVQWMTAGRGVIHSEMPEQTEGLVRGFQLWLNLPKDKKMIPPAYKDIPAENIPRVDFPGGTAKVIAGEFMGATGPGQPHTGMFYYDIELQSEKELSIPVIDGWNAFLYVYEGTILIDQTVKKDQLAVLGKAGDCQIKAADQGAQFIVAAGKPLNEPVSRGGPFVMNTRSEIIQAFTDYQTGVLDKV